MRKLQILKTFIDIFWFMSLITAVGCLVFLPILFMSDEMFDVPFKINGNTIVVVDLFTKIILSVYIIAFYIFAFGVFKLRKLLELFRKKIIFEEQNSLLLNQIGICFLTSSALSAICGFIYATVGNNKLEFALNNGFDSFLFTASISLFFMVLSEVFKIARKATTENDLTI